MVGRSAVALVVGMILAMGVPALAADEPNVTDPCGSVAGTREAVRAEHDICAVWLSTLSGPDEPVVLEARIRLAGSVEGRDPSSYHVGWEAGGCRLLFLASDENSAAFPSERQLLVDCDGSRRRLDLPPEVLMASSEGRDVTFTITFTGELAGFAADHDHGMTLVAPSAGAAGRIGPYGLGLYGWDDNLGTYSLLYDHAEDDRPYTVGDA